MVYASSMENFTINKKDYSDFAASLKQISPKGIYPVLEEINKFVENQFRWSGHFEKNRISQDLLSSVGVQSTIVNGKLKIEGKQESHPFNLIDYKHSKILFDPANPLYYKVGEKVYSAAAVMPNVSFGISTVFDPNFVKEKIKNSNHIDDKFDRLFDRKNPKREYFYPEKFTQKEKEYI